MTPGLAVQLTFYYLAAASVASALLAVTRRNPVHSVLWVLALFMHVAGIFLIVGAEFLAAVQVIVYAGAILVFYLFVLMLLDLPTEESGPRFGTHWPFAAAAGVGFAAIAWYASGSSHYLASPAGPRTEGPSFGSLGAIGRALFTDYALPFEIVSLILLAAIVGTIAIAKRKEA
jgi:NADH-quinone oxidoreductase subunit J